MSVTVKFLKYTRTDWTTTQGDPVIDDRRLVFEDQGDGTVKALMGNGTDAYSALEYLTADAAGALLAANNLSDVANAATARANLGAGDTTGQASSVDSEIALFSGTGGKTIKRATTTGILKASSGVIAAAVASTDYIGPTSGSAVQKASGGGLTAATPGTDFYAPGSTDVAITDGGTGVSSLPTGILKGAGIGAITAATSGTDYAPATSGSAILKGNGSGGFSSASSGTDYAPATSGSAILKGNGSGGFSSAASGTDYAPATSGSAILKGNGSGGFSSATAGTDYTSPTSTETQTNKRKQPRVNSQASTSTLTPEIDTYDVFRLTAQAAGLTIANHSSSTPADGEQMRISILDNGTARSISFGTNYVARGGVALPTTTTISKLMTLGFEWYADLSKWVLLGLAQES